MSVLRQRGSNSSPRSFRRVVGKFYFRETVFLIIFAKKIDKPYMCIFNNIFLKRCGYLGVVGNAGRTVQENTKKYG